MHPYQFFNKLNVIDGTSDTIITTMYMDDFDDVIVSLDQYRKYLAADLQNNQIFIANYDNCLISVIDPTDTGIVTEPLTEITEKFVLQQNYPNP